MLVGFLLLCVWDLIKGGTRADGTGDVWREQLAGFEHRTRNSEPETTLNLEL